jgi:hypothetical protein
VSSDASQLPSIFVSLVNEDGTVLFPANASEMNLIQSSLKLTCSKMVSGGSGGKKKRKDAVELYEAPELSSNATSGGSSGVLFRGIKFNKPEVGGNQEEEEEDEDQQEEDCKLKPGKYLCTLRYCEKRDDIVRAFRGVGDDATQVCYSHTHVCYTCL